MSAKDPCASLTRHEKAKVAELEKRLDHDQTLEELKTDLQTAVWIELATIPIYLFTYYSLYRNKTSGEQLEEPELFANKAGGIIMSVAVEEMLHMSLSSNILYSLGVDPQLYLHSPARYPTPLPHHYPFGPPGPHGGRRSRVKIPLSKLTYDQLWHFLQIEYPEPRRAWPKDKKWKTIGQFYSYIRCLICSSKITDKDFRARGRGSKHHQIQSYNYSPNNIDTVYPSGAFNPWALPKPAPQRKNNPSASKVAVYPNEPDSHAGPTELITIGSKAEALNAIETICEQGEGYAHRPTDNPSQHDHAKKEESHYYKFLTLQAQFEHYKRHIEKLPRRPKPPPPVTPTITVRELAKAGVLFDFPRNPTTARYAGDPDAVALSNLCNGVYQYMLILTETVFRVPHPEQKLFFNQAMHYSMIWVLDKLIQSMRRHQITAGRYQGKALAPTFENYDLGERKDAYRNLLQLTRQTPATQEWASTIIPLPDVSAYWS